MGHVSSKQPDVGRLRANVCPPIEEPNFDDLRMAFNSEMRRSFKITEDGFKRLMIEKHPLLDQKRIEKIIPALYKVYDQGMWFFPHKLTDTSLSHIKEIIVYLMQMETKRWTWKSFWQCQQYLQSQPSEITDSYLQFTRQRWQWVHYQGWVWSGSDQSMNIWNCSFFKFHHGKPE